MNAVRHSLLAQQLPLLYIMMLIAAVLVLFTFRNSAPLPLISVVPVILFSSAIIRTVHWFRLRRTELTEQQINRQIRATMILGPVMAFGFTVWAGLLFDYGDAYQQAFIALMVLICATVTSVCTAAMPATSSLIIVAACLPFTIKLLADDNEVLATMVVAFATIGVLLHKILRQYYHALTDVIESRNLLTRRNNEVTAAKREVTRIAYTDELTGIANKRHFNQKLNELIEHHPDPQQSLVVGIIDLDGFATINDVFGYAFGDAVLKEAANRLQTIFAGKDFVARYEGDEFAFILNAAADEHEAMHIATEVCKTLEQHYHIGGDTAILAASCGLAAFPQSADNADLLRSRAYYALHEAKTSDRTHIALFSPRHEQSIQSRSQIEQALRLAIHENKLDVSFQPIMDIEAGKPVAFEALARWHDSELGHISPVQFISTAERTGLISELMVQLLEKASATARSWPSSIQLSFNMSAKEIVRTSTGLRTLSILNENQLPGQRLDIEITETALLENFNAASSTIQNLKMAGVSIALDDFGTGHASLGYVGKIDLDKLKIDRSFATGINENIRNQHIVKAIIDMCGNLDIRCIAEGVETPAELETLRKLGCKYAQGYLFGRPMPADETFKFIADCVQQNTTPLNQAAG
ncbi:MAG: EAL domain-containing protein [Rhizobiales bacterium]|nr:EAL domain-containing protein [Hyphomicrobiales bacterium]